MVLLKHRSFHGSILILLKEIEVCPVLGDKMRVAISNKDDQNVDQEQRGDLE